MQKGPRIADLIDDLLVARKTVAGEPDWRDIYHGESRLVMPLHVGGVSSGSDLHISAYPLIGDSKFRIMLCAPKCVWRVDHVFDELHVNSFNRPADLKELSFSRPHYHAWADNRRFCTHATLPDRLENARILQKPLSFDSVLRWFCGETNIEQPQSGAIALPQRRDLL